jgi:hypothetical protein
MGGSFCGMAAASVWPMEDDDDDDFSDAFANVAILFFESRLFFYGNGG